MCDKLHAECSSHCDLLLQQYYSSTYSNFIDLINAAAAAPGSNLTRATPHTCHPLLEQSRCKQVQQDSKTHAAAIAESFNDPATSLTLFAATNAGMNASLASVGSRPAAVERSPALSLKILQYNILPSPITVSCPLHASKLPVLTYPTTRQEVASVQLGWLKRWYVLQSGKAAQATTSPDHCTRCSVSGRHSWLL